MGGEILKDKFSELSSFAKIKWILVSKAHLQEDLVHLFHLPLYGIAFEQLQSAKNLLDEMDFPIINNSWGYVWGNLFSAFSAYKCLIG